jgi:hypothetical protein
MVYTATRLSISSVRLNLRLVWQGRLTSPGRFCMLHFHTCFLPSAPSLTHLHGCLHAPICCCLQAFGWGHSPRTLALFDQAALNNGLTPRKHVPLVTRVTVRDTTSHWATVQYDTVYGKRSEE